MCDIIICCQYLNGFNITKKESCLNLTFFFFFQLSHITFSFCLEIFFLFWNCFFTGFHTRKKKFFFLKKQNKTKQNKHTHPQIKFWWAFLLLYFTHELSELLFFSLMEKWIPRKKGASVFITWNLRVWKVSSQLSTSATHHTSWENTLLLKHNEE